MARIYSAKMNFEFLWSCQQYPEWNGSELPFAIRRLLNTATPFSLLLPSSFPSPSFSLIALSYPFSLPSPFPLSTSSRPLSPLLSLLFVPSSPSPSPSPLHLSPRYVRFPLLIFPFPCFLLSTLHMTQFEFLFFPFLFLVAFHLPYIFYSFSLFLSLYISIYLSLFVYHSICLNIISLSLSKLFSFLSYFKYHDPPAVMTSITTC